MSMALATRAAAGVNTSTPLFVSRPETLVLAAAAAAVLHLQTARSPYPNDSELYNAIRERVKKEVFKGAEVKGAHRSGSELAAAAILGYAAAAYGLYTWDANPFTGFLLGLAGAWIGLTVQHCGGLLFRDYPEHWPADRPS